jgi:hypothetical protein
MFARAAGFGAIGSMDTGLRCVTSQEQFDMSKRERTFIAFFITWGLNRFLFPLLKFLPAHDLHSFGGILMDFVLWAGTWVLAIWALDRASR